MPVNVMVIALIPMDIDSVVRALSLGSTLEIPSDYTKTICDDCGKGAWIAPRQLELYTNTPYPVARLCYVCLLTKRDTYTIVSLGNPNAAKEKPL